MRAALDAEKARLAEIRQDRDSPRSSRVGAPVVVALVAGSVGHERVTIRDRGTTPGTWTVVDEEHRDLGRITEAVTTSALA